MNLCEISDYYEPIRILTNSFNDSGYPVETSHEDLIRRKLSPNDLKKHIILVM